MAKSAIEKAIERQQKEAKRLADKQLREQKRLAEKEMNHQVASTIVNGQPIIGDIRILDKASAEILKYILFVYDNNEERNVRGNYGVIPAAYHTSLNLEFEKLKLYGMISRYSIWINAMWELNLTPQGITYFEDKEKAMEREDEKMKTSINIGNIVANGSNLVLGDVINSVLSIDNSVKRIEKEIEEKGGDESEELLEILVEVKELIENMQESRHIPKNKGLFSKASRHLEKHGWFYGEIVGLIGAAAMNMLQG